MESKSRNYFPVILYFNFDVSIIIQFGPFWTQLTNIKLNDLILQPLYLERRQTSGADSLLKLVL